MSQECTSFIVDGSHSLIESKQYNSIIQYLKFVLIEKCKKMRKTDYVSLYISNTYDMINDEDIEDIVQLCSCSAPVNGQLMHTLVLGLTKYDNLDEIKKVDEGGQMITKTMLLSAIQVRQKFNTRKIKKQMVIFSDNIDALDLEEDELGLVKDQLTDTKLILVNCSYSTGVTKGSQWDQIIKFQNAYGIDSCVVSIEDLMKRIDEVQIPLVTPIRIFSGVLRFGASVEDIASLDPRIREKFFEDKFSLCMTVEGYPATKAVPGLNRKIMIRQPKEKSDDDNNKQFEYFPVKSIIEYEISRSQTTDENIDSQDGHIKREEEIKEEKKSKIKTEGSDNSGKSRNVIIGVQNITKAYRYGSDYVVVPPTLLEQMEYHAAPGLDIRGFASRLSLPRQYLTSESTMIVPDTRLGNQADVRSFNTLVDVLVKHDKIAIARYVSKFNGDVSMVCLCPLLVSNSDVMKSEYLLNYNLNKPDDYRNTHTRMMILNVLPYMEDEKHMIFPSLLNPRTSSGNIKREQNNLDDDLMQKFIDSMDTDDIPSADSALLYRHYNESNNKHSTSVLLRKNNSTDDLLNSDPTMRPNVTLHYKNLVLNKWIEQKYLSQDPTSKTFELPQLPKSLKDETMPYVSIKKTLTEEDKNKIKEAWKTQDGELLTAASGQKSSGSSTYWLATELGPSQFDLN